MLSGANAPLKTSFHASAIDSLSTSENTSFRFPIANWKNIFALLGLVIVADKNALNKKVDEYLDVINELRTVIDPTACISRHMAEDWFALNRSHLEKIADGLTKDDDTVLCNIIAPLKTIPNVFDVITCMVRIAVSDDDYSPAEKNLMQKTVLYLNIKSPAVDPVGAHGATKDIESVLFEDTLSSLWDE